MKKMGKKFITGTAMAVTAISSAGLLSGCFFSTPSVYGPPPDVPTEVSTTVTEETTSETTLSEEVNTIDPSSEILEGVYGPPSDYSFETVTPEDEINEDVYGPPIGN